MTITRHRPDDAVPKLVGAAMPSAPTRPAATTPGETTPADPPSGGPYIGRPLDRVDGDVKTTGAARYTAEIPLANLTHAALVLAEVTKGRILSIDTAAALAHPGVINVITHLNAPKMEPPPTRFNPLDLSTMAHGSTILYLHTDEVMVDGQPIAVVVAETPEAAHYAATLVTARYSPLPATVDFDAQWRNGTVVKGLPVGPQMRGRVGDAVSALAAAPHRVDLNFSTPQHNHNAIEPHATTAFWDDDRLTVFEATQNLDWFAKNLARAFDIPLKQVRVISEHIGGGFGGKGAVWAGTLIGCMAARVVGRPVRLSLTREAVNRLVGGRTPTKQRVAMGAESDGTLTALVHQATTRTGKVGGDAESVTACSHDLYRVPNVLAEQRVVELDLMANTFMRAPGESTGTFGVESAMDELAYELGRDPVELRIHNEPERSAIGNVPYSHRRTAEALRRGAGLFGWADRPAAGTMVEGELTGWGVALAYHSAFEFTTNVEVSLDVSGRATVSLAGQEIGVGIATAAGQVAADLLGVRFEDVQVRVGDTELPTAASAGGSAQTAGFTAALIKAADILRGKLGGRHAVASPFELLLASGQPAITVRSGADTGLGSLPGQLSMLRKIAFDRRRFRRAATGAHFCEVRVDPDTGETRVRRWVGVFDIGRVLNHKTAASQLRGGIVFGIGLALTEQTLIDPRNGRIMNTGLNEYHIPVSADVPAMRVEFIDDPDPRGPLGTVGAGELGITGAGAAIANAIRHATGRRLTTLPIKLDAVVG